MKLRFDRPHNTYVHLEIGRFSSTGNHATILEGVVIAFIDIVKMWLDYDVVHRQPKDRTRFKESDEPHKTKD